MNKLILECVTDVAGDLFGQLFEQMKEDNTVAGEVKCGYTDYLESLEIPAGKNVVAGKDRHGRKYVGVRIKTYKYVGQEMVTNEGWYLVWQRYSDSSKHFIGTFDSVNWGHGTFTSNSFQAVSNLINLLSGCEIEKGKKKLCMKQE